MHLQISKQLWIFFWFASIKTMINENIRLVFILLTIIGCNVTASEEATSNKSETLAAPSDDLHLRVRQIEEAKAFAQVKGIRQDFFLLFDLRIHSGKKRLFLVDLRSGEAIDSFMVAHGAGASPWGRDFTKDKAQTSNTVNSHLTSVGRYLVGKRDYSNWGINVKYWLYGQDSTNSNAVKRVVVLHSWDHTPDEENYPDGTPESWGCPAVSNRTMKKMDELLSSSTKKMLLWIVN
jgi:hypothetical protein